MRIPIVEQSSQRPLRLFGGRGRIAVDLLCGVGSVVDRRIKLCELFISIRQFRSVAIDVFFNGINGCAVIGTHTYLIFFKQKKYFVPCHVC